MDDLTIYGGGRMGPSALEGLNSYRRSVGLAELSPAEYAEYQKGSPGVEFPADAAWDADALSAPPQAVLHRGSSWRALRPTLGDEPGAADDAWALLAQGGDVAMVDAAVAQATAAGAAQVALAEQAAGLAGQQAGLASDLAAAAAQDRMLAQSAAEAAVVIAEVYPNTAAGLAATLEGEQFSVVSGDYVIRYRNTSGVAVEVLRLRNGASLAAVDNTSDLEKPLSGPQAAAIETATEAVQDTLGAPTLTVEGWQSLTVDGAGRADHGRDMRGRSWRAQYGALAR